GEPVVLHDPTLTRVTGGRDDRPVHTVARADLPRLACGARIPDLADALDLCHGHIVNVEMKSDVPHSMVLGVASVRATAREFARAGGAGRNVVVSSFDPSQIALFAVASRRIPRAILVGPRTPRLGGLLPLALKRLVMAAHLEEGLTTASRVRRLAEAGLRV